MVDFAKIRKEIEETRKKKQELKLLLAAQKERAEEQEELSRLKKQVFQTSKTGRVLKPVAKGLAKTGKFVGKKGVEGLKAIGKQQAARFREEPRNRKMNRKRRQKPRDVGDIVLSGGSWL